MNDNDIIKALECCAFEHNCNGCFYNVPESAYSAQCIEKIMHASLDLINRQKAEIERLKDMVSQNEGVLPKYERIIKDEAIKEFADVLKESQGKISVMSFVHGTKDYIPVENIDNLVKEMTEGGE